jgi:hypothetical protein
MLRSLEGAPAMLTLFLANRPASLGLGSEYVRHFIYSNTSSADSDTRGKKESLHLDNGQKLENGEGETGDVNIREAGR